MTAQAETVELAAVTESLAKHWDPWPRLFLLAMGAVVVAWLGFLGWFFTHI